MIANWNKSVFALLLFGIGLMSAYAQPRQITPPSGEGQRFVATGVITGQVWDTELSAPVEYANVVLYRLTDSSTVTGTVTDAQGRFALHDAPPGRFFLEVSFIGYKTRRVPNVQLPPGGKVDLGRINLEPVAIAVPGTEVTAEKPKLEYRVDKKIINVAQNPALQSGTAVDALENAPGVKVDAEDNVTLRGLTSFTVLVDGKPSPFEGSEALKQIPASTIDRIEIVTNPSVKFDPEGKAGIINVILKKQRQQGISGIVNLTAGTNSQFGGNLLLTARGRKATTYIGPNFNQMNFPGTREVYREIKRGDTISGNYSTGSSSFGRRFSGVRAGVDWQLTPQDGISIGGRIGGMGGTRTQVADYQEWVASGSETISSRSYIGRTYSADKGNQFSANLDANHNFGKKGYELTLKAFYSKNTRTDSTQTEDRTENKILSGKQTIENNQGHRLEVKLDYIRPLREKDKFEAGYQTRARLGPKETSRIWSYDSVNGIYQPTPEYSHTTEQRDLVHAFYSTYTGSYRDLGAMLGLRTEFSGRRVVIDDSTFVPLNQWNLFPSIHLSYSLPKEQQVMASYTRRIERPRGWDLAPTRTWMDAKNLRQGNPDLKPEFIDSYEVGFLFTFGKHRLSLDGYYRITRNVIERFQQVYQDSLILHTVKNINKDQALGAEMSLNLIPVRWWDLNLTGTVYDYRLKLPEGNQQSFNWDFGLTSDFNLPTSTKLQFSGQYESPSATAQGTEGAHIWTSAALRQAFLKRQLVLTLSVRDILASSFHENTSQGENFFSRSQFRRKGPTLSLGLTYNFNNYRQERRWRQGEEEETEPIIEYY